MVGMHFLLFVMCFSIVLYIFSMWWSAYLECGKYTLIKSMCWRLTRIMVLMARSLMYSVSMILFLHLLFSMIPTPCLLSYVPAPIKMWLCCVSHSSAGSCLHVSFNRISSHLYPSSSVTNSSIFHLNALTSCFLKNDKGHFLVFQTYIFTSARRIVHDTMLHFTSSAASAFFFFAPFSYAAAGFIAVSQFSSQTQRNISINDAVLESSSSFASCVFYFFLLRHHCHFCSFSFVLVIRLRLSCGSSC